MINHKIQPLLMQYLLFNIISQEPQATMDHKEDSYNNYYLPFFLSLYIQNDFKWTSDKSDWINNYQGAF
jgi:hypothetical protein